ncbi:MAG: Ig-like domain-containing protein [Arenicellales bacterium WSBS_2016_MAG_OTU3]
MTYVLNTTAPTVVLTGPATFSTAEAFEVTATFDEPVTGFNSVNDITVNGGTA